MSNDDKFKIDSKKLFDFADEISEEEDLNNDIEDLDELIESENYEVGDIIATGGLKVVRQARDRRASRDLAMAQLKPEFSSGINMERLLREAKTLANLEHANIVPIHEISYSKDKQLFFTMKLLSGETLASIIKKIKDGNEEYIKNYPLRKLLDIYIKVCDAISFAHSKDVVHLDIKPENIQVSDFGEVYVIDWGMAKHVGDAESLHYQKGNDLMEFSLITSNQTQTGIVSGTLGYMSPEQADSENLDTGKPSDIYSMGATLYAIIYNQRPYSNLNAKEILKKTESGLLPDFPEKKHGKPVSSALRAVAKKAMMPDPDDRYPSVIKLKEDIELYMNDFATQAEDISFANILQLFLKRHYTGVVIALIVSLIITVISYYSISTIWEKDRKLKATADEVIFGTLGKEEEMRFAFKYKELIRDYSQLLSVGYNYPVFKLKLARLLVGELRINDAQKLINDIANGNSETRNSKEFQILQKAVEGFISNDYSVKNNSHISLLAKSLGVDFGYRSDRVHIFYSFHKNNERSVDQMMVDLEEQILTLNESMKGKINLRYGTENGELTVDLSNNKYFTNKGPIICIPIVHLNLSNTNSTANGFFNYPSISKRLKTLIFDRHKDGFSKKFMELSKITKLSLKHVQFGGTNLQDNLNLKHLDVEHGKFGHHFWKSSPVLEYLNIAFSDFDDFDALKGMTGLQELIISESLNIPKGILNNMRARGVKVVVKQPPVKKPKDRFDRAFD